MTTEHKNPLLEKVIIPGETFRIPSQGLFYTDGELAEHVVNGEVNVTPMNAMDELNLKSPDKLLSGKAVIDIFRRCIPDILKPEELNAKDVDYLLMCLRLVSYGATYDLQLIHDCENAKEHSYAVELRPFIQKAKSVDPTKLKNYKLTLDNGQTVTLHPPKFLSTIRLYEIIGADVENEEEYERMGVQLINSISDMIDDVDGHTDRADIQEWLKTIRVGDVQKISEKVSQLSDWGVDPEIELECRDCKEKMTAVLPLNPVSFFI